MTTTSVSVKTQSSSAGQSGSESHGQSKSDKKAVFSIGMEILSIGGIHLLGMSLDIFHATNFHIRCT